MPSGENSSSEKAAEVEPPSTAPVEVGGPPGPPPPPNGGTTAWLQVLGAFCIMLNTWGLLNSFGVFQAEYSTGLLSSSTDSAISWIGSIQGFMMLTTAVVSGRALDAGYFYPVIVGGIFLETFGMMMASISTQYWQIFLSEGIVVGIGAGMLFILSVAIVGTYFSTRRATAVGIAATGSGVGGVVYPIILRRLISGVGIAWAIRAIAFIMLATLLVSIAVMKPRLPPRKSGPLVDVQSLKDPAFTLWLVGIFILFIGLYIPFFYIELYALNLGIDKDLASYILITINAASIPGRVFPSMMADRIGNLHIIISAVLLSGVIFLSWIAVETQSALFAVAVLAGFANGSIQAVVPSCTAFLCPDLSKLGSNIGITLFSAGLGILIGNPIAGIILGSQSSEDHLTFWGTLLFSGIFVIAGGLLLCAVRIMKVGFVLAKA